MNSGFCQPRTEPMGKAIGVVRASSLAVTLLVSAALPLLAVATPAGAQPGPRTQGGASPKKEAAAAGPFEAAMTEVAAQLKARQFAAALANVEKLLGVAHWAPASRVAALQAAIAASQGMGQEGVEKTLFYARELAFDSSLPNVARIQAFNDLADASIRIQSGKNLDAMSLQEADEALDLAARIPELTPAQKALAFKYRGLHFQRQGLHSRARELFLQIPLLAVPQTTHKEAWRLVADSYAREGRQDDALALYKENGWDIIELFILTGDHARRQEACLQLLQTPFMPEEMRYNAFRRLPMWDRYSIYADQIPELAAQFGEEFYRSQPQRALFLRQYLGTPRAPGITDAFVAWAAPWVLQVPSLADKDYNAVKVAQINATIASRGWQEAQPLLEEARKDKRITPETRLWAALARESGRGQGVGTARDLLVKAAEVPVASRANALLDAAKTLLIARQNQESAALYQLYEGLLKPSKPAAVTCRFVPRAPGDVGGWLASPMLKTLARSGGTAPLDRPYGKNLKFLLETDSAVMGRNATEAGGADEAGSVTTEMAVLCDDRGISIFLDASDRRAAEVQAGLVRGGSFEMYLAPGKQQAYHTFLLGLPRTLGDGSAFLSMYPNEGFRPLSRRDGTFTVQNGPTPQGFGTCLFLAWETFYDKLPQDGTRWQLESIRWTRAGGYSFGGSQSVHNRSSWGDMVFANLTPANLTQIKRNIVYSAWDRYKKARSVTGVVGQWSDRDLGDLGFYQGQVAPLFSRLDALGQGVKASMTDAEVNSLFDEAVPDWMEIEFKVAALRSQYLRARQLSGTQDLPQTP